MFGTTLRRILATGQVPFAFGQNQSGMALVHEQANNQSTKSLFLIKNVNSALSFPNYQQQQRRLVHRSRATCDDEFMRLRKNPGGSIPMGSDWYYRHIRGRKILAILRILFVVGVATATYRSWGVPHEDWLSQIPGETDDMKNRDYEQILEIQRKKMSVEDIKRMEEERKKGAAISSSKSL